MRAGRGASLRVDGCGAHREVRAGSDERIAARRAKTSFAHDGRISQTRKRGSVAKLSRHRCNESCPKTIRIHQKSFGTLTVASNYAISRLLNPARSITRTLRRRQVL